MNFADGNGNGRIKEGKRPSTVATGWAAKESGGWSNSKNCSFPF